MGSEVAELRKRLEEEYIAGRRALYAPASGWSKHAFIEARMRNMERCHERLCELVGPEQALKLVFEVFERGESLLPERVASQGQGAASGEAMSVAEVALSETEAGLLEREQAGVGLAVSDGPVEIRSRCRCCRRAVLLARTSRRGRRRSGCWSAVLEPLRTCSISSMPPMKKRRRLWPRSGYAS